MRKILLVISLVVTCLCSVTFAEEVKNGVEKSYYLNTNLKSEVNYINGQKEGLAKYYRDNGNLEREGSHIKGEADGIFKYYYKDGSFQEERNYKNDKLLDKSGNPMNGEYKRFYRNGQLEFERHYKNGKREGSNKFYYENGQLSEEGNYKDGKAEGLYKWYHENGKLKQQVTIKSNKFEGLQERYNENGGLLSEGNFINGKVEGAFTTYWGDGSIRIIDHWKNGNLEGVQKNYYKSGALAHEKIWKNGVENGDFVTYYENGTIKESGVYVDGKKYLSEIQDMVKEKLIDENKQIKPSITKDDISFKIKYKKYDGNNFIIGYSITNDSKFLIENLQVRAVWEKLYEKEIIHESLDSIVASYSDTPIGSGYSKSSELKYKKPKELSEAKFSVYVSINGNKQELIQKDIMVSIPSISKDVKFNITGMSYSAAEASGGINVVYLHRIDYRITNISNRPINNLRVKVVWFEKGKTEILSEKVVEVINSYSNSPLNPGASKTEWIISDRGYTNAAPDFTADIYISEYDKYELVYKKINYDSYQNLSRGDVPIKTKEYEVLVEPEKDDEVPKPSNVELEQGNEDESTLEVTGIMLGEESIAIINDEMVKTGDIIQGAKILEIGSDFVKFNLEGEEFIIQLKATKRIKSKFIRTKSTMDVDEKIQLRREANKEKHIDKADAYYEKAKNLLYESEPPYVYINELYKDAEHEMGYVFQLSKSEDKNKVKSVITKLKKEREALKSEVDKQKKLFKNAIRNRGVLYGMPKSDVIKSIGQPIKKERLREGDNEEKLTFLVGPPGKKIEVYHYFENGFLVNPN